MKNEILFFPYVNQFITEMLKIIEDTCSKEIAFSKSQTMKGQKSLYLSIFVT